MEGSHAFGETDDMDGGIDYEFGEDHILFVNLDCKCSFPTGAISGSLFAMIPHVAAR
jgi:hypothetical protein